MEAATPPAHPVDEAGVALVGEGALAERPHTKGDVSALEGVEELGGGGEGGDSGQSVAVSDIQGLQASGSLWLDVCMLSLALTSSEVREKS
jgi:hypothetical protein